MNRARLFLTISQVVQVWAMFEFLFKYPRYVYARGQFALLGAWPHWMLALLIVAAAVGLAWLIRSRMTEAAPVMRSWRVWVIWGLQTLLAAMVLVLLWQPAITVVGVEAATKHHRRAGGRLPQHGHIRGRRHPPGPSREGASERRSGQPQPHPFKRVFTASTTCPPASTASRTCNPTRPRPASATASSS